MIRLVFERLGPAQRARRRRRDRPRRPEARRSQRRRGRLQAQGRGRSVAGVPGRPDQHRAGAGHPGRGLGPDPREDVREPPVLRRQARSRWAPTITICDPHRAIVIGPRRLRGAARRVARHPRRHGDADRRAVRRRAAARSATSARSTAATSASTSACASSARASSASRRAGARASLTGSGSLRRHDPPASPAARATCCPTRCASCARSPTRCAASSSAAGYGEVYTPALEYEAVLRARRRRRRGPPTGCSTSTATCSCCART